MKYSISLGCFLILSLSLSGQISKSDDGLFYDDNGDLFTGVYTETYPSGIIKSETTLKDGQKHGETKTYFENGKTSEVQNYKNNLMHGKWESFNIDGVQIAEANYKKGKKHGKWIIWDDHGTLRYDMTYKNAQRTGIWYIFDESGKLVSSKDYR
jgi:antitoxin component YwqK of YwqJK toxin-antitoxin module